MVALDLEGQVVDVAPDPVLLGFERLDQRVVAGVEVGGGVAVGGAVTAPDVGAGGAPAEVNPSPSDLKALDTTVTAGFLGLQSVEVRARLSHIVAQASGGTSGCDDRRRTVGPRLAGPLLAARDQFCEGVLQAGSQFARVRNGDRVDQQAHVQAAVVGQRRQIERSAG
jgi:hypothetical protein